MKFELPELQKCCCYFPLTTGLLVWGYLKLVIIVIEIYFSIVDGFIFFLYMGMRNHRRYSAYLFMPLALTTMLLVDFIFTVIFLVAAHKRHRSTMKAYYYYLIIIMVVDILLATAFMCMELFFYNGPEFDITTPSVILIINFLYISSHVYFFLLVSSEIKKMKELEVTMTYNNTGDVEVATEIAN